MLEEIQISKLSVNAILTMLTVVIIALIALNKGSLGISSWLRRIHRSHLTIYVDVYVYTFWVLLLLNQIYRLLGDLQPLTRLDVFYIANSIAALWFFLGQLHNELMAARRKSESPNSQSARWKIYES